VDGVVALFERPAVAIPVTLLLLVLAALAGLFFWRSYRARKTRDLALAQELQLRRQFEAVLSSARDGVLIVSHADEVALISDVAAKVLGVARDDAVGVPVSRLNIRAVDEQMHPILLRDAFGVGTTDEAPRIVGVPGRRGADDVRWVQIRARAVPDGLDGKPVTVTWIDWTAGVVGLTAADGHPIVLPLAVFEAAVTHPQHEEITR